MSGNLDGLDDSQLIALVCAGDKQAGNILCAKHQRKLLTTIQCLSQDLCYRGEPAEDLAQEVWLALFRDDFKRLKNYDAGQGKFGCFLKEISKDLILQRLRAQSRRPGRRVPLKEHEPEDPGADDGLVHAELAEYLEHLTPRESRYLHENLLRDSKPANERPLSRGNEYTVKHRMRRKLADHLDIP